MKTSWSEEILIISTVLKINLSKSYQNFPAEFFLGFIWYLEYKVPLDYVLLMVILDIFF